MAVPAPTVSIIVPAKDAATTLRRALDSLIRSVAAADTEIIVVNDGCDNAVARLSSEYRVKIIDGNGSGPAAARNIGVQSSKGRLLVFLDADCSVLPDWLESHQEAHQRYAGLLAVGGSICMEPEAGFWARCDHYCSWYNVNSFLPPSWVPNHPTVNLSMIRSTFDRVGPFREDLPQAGGHEDLEWHGRLLDLGGRVRFEPRAVACHVDRDDLKSYLKHNYRWGYNSILVKSGTRISRFPWVYRRPWIIMAGFLPFAVAHTLYTLRCWLRAGTFEPILLSPFILLGRLAYATGMVAGGLRVVRSATGKPKKS
jgi:glycosyltransferase involved in cell wall biosynthesis